MDVGGHLGPLLGQHPGLALRHQVAHEAIHQGPKINTMAAMTSSAPPTGSTAAVAGGRRGGGRAR